MREIDWRAGNDQIGAAGVDRCRQGALLGVGGKLASQIKQKSEGDEPEGDAATEAVPAAESAPAEASAEEKPAEPPAAEDKTADGDEPKT